MKKVKKNNLNRVNVLLLIICVLVLTLGVYFLVKTFVKDDEKKNELIDYTLVDISNDNKILESYFDIRYTKESIVGVAFGEGYDFYVENGKAVFVSGTDKYIVEGVNDVKQVLVFNNLGCVSCNPVIAILTNEGKLYYKVLEPTHGYCYEEVDNKEFISSVTTSYDSLDDFDKYDEIGYIKSPDLFTTCGSYLLVAKTKDGGVNVFSPSFDLERGVGNLELISSDEFRMNEYYDFENLWAEEKGITLFINKDGSISATEVCFIESCYYDATAYDSAKSVTDENGKVIKLYKHILASDEVNSEYDSLLISRDGYLYSIPESFTTDYKLKKVYNEKIKKVGYRSIDEYTSEVIIILEDDEVKHIGTETYYD